MLTLITGMHDVAEQGLNIQKEQLQAQKNLAKEKLSKEEQKCHQLFRLTNGSSGATYEWYKERVEERLENTYCSSEAAGVLCSANQAAELPQFSSSNARLTQQCWE